MTVGSVVGDNVKITGEMCQLTMCQVAGCWWQRCRHHCDTLKQRCRGRKSSLYNGFQKGAYFFLFLSFLFIWLIIERHHTNKTLINSVLYDFKNHLWLLTISRTDICKPSQTSAQIRTSSFRLHFGITISKAQPNTARSVLNWMERLRESMGA